MTPRADIPSHIPQAPWAYFHPPCAGLVELGTVSGLAVALPTHFHDEDQFVFVLAGQRSFVFEDGSTAIVPEGEGLLIQAGTPHRSLAEASEVLCLNLYAQPGLYDKNLIPALARHWTNQRAIAWPESNPPRQRATEPAPAPVIASVSAAARSVGVSREAYSRRFRREHGVPPQQFQLMSKLNAARRLLRDGESIAGVAAETGFADQSHLGRLFRRSFGVTPGRYRDGWNRSHPFQTTSRQP